MAKCSTKKKTAVIISLVLVVALITGCAVYLGDYYRADSKAVAAYSSVSGVKIDSDSEGIITFIPESETDTALVFYPGGKVEYEAYIPLMSECAERGIMCVLIEMPFNLAVFDVNAAQGIQEKYPQIENWYIGGHSLGGSMAASFAAENPDAFSGIVLLGSYSTADITGFDVLSVYGSEDKVLNAEKYEKYKTNLPKNFTEFVIDGGCHAYFGTYGLQDGDGTPKITNEQQIELTAEKIHEFTKRSS